MKRLLKTVKSMLLGGLLLTSAVVEAQFTGSYPISQPGNYLSTYQGRTPASPNKQHAIDAYNSWKQNFVTSSGACGEQRVIFDYYQGGLGKTDRSQTVSEGIAYGMLLSAYAGDRPLFDDLWAYYKRHRNGNGVMHWKIENCNVIGPNGATDAELDVAMALVVASHQWQNDGYLNDARTMIRIIREKQFEGTVLKPGDMFGGSNLTNPSYFSPAYYRVFAQLEPQHATFWTNAATRGYEIIEAAEKFNNGLVPDWCRADGNFSNDAGGYYMNGQRFFFDAVRTPFRTSIDYLWHGTPRAQAYCNRLIQWSFNAHGGGTEQLQSNYSIDGTPHGGGHSNTFVGCFAIAAMSTGGGTLNNSQYDSYLNRAYADNQNTQPGYGQYFNASIKAIANFVMNGYFYLPPPDQCDAPNLGADKSLCAGNVTLDAGVGTAGTHTYSWRRNGQTIAGTGKTLSVTTAGEYEVIVRQNSNGCTRRDKISVFAAQIIPDFTFTVGPGVVILQNTTQGGISNSSWAQGTDVFSTDQDAEYDYNTDGAVDITLTVNNTGFGCSNSVTVTKTIVLGGNGWAADEFNTSSNVTTWIADNPLDNPLIYDPLPRNWCSADARDDGDAKECPDNPCGLFRVNVKSTVLGGQYAPFGVNFNDGVAPNGNPIQTSYDITSVPFVSMRIRSSANVTLGVGLNDGSLTTDRLQVPLLANQWTVLTATDLDFTNNQTGWTQANPATPVDFTNIRSLQLFPREFTTTFSGTIEVDWIIVGATSLPAPEFDIKRDADGLPVYEDPDGDDVYTVVPAWEKEVVTCDETATLTAITCTADEIRWYNGNTQFAIGESVEVGPGTYIVELVNQGGTKRDTVTVRTSTLTADFLIDNVNYGAHFINQSTGFTSFEWNYGDPNLVDPESPTWEIGYHNYEEGVGALAEKTFTVGLTVFNSTCGTELTVTKQLTIACDKLPSDIVVVESTTEGCEGDQVTFEIEASEYAGDYGWYFPDGTTHTLSEDKLTATVTFGPNPGELAIEAYNACTNDTDKKVSTLVMLDIVPTPSSDFTMTPSAATGLTVDLEAVTRIADSYSWSFGDGSNESGESPDVSHTYADEDVYNICLTVVNTCGTPAEVCKPYSAVINSLSALDKAGMLEFFPTITSDFININLRGAAQYSIIDVSGIVVKGNSALTSNRINVSDLESGVYTVRIQQGDDIVSKRFVKN